MSASLSADCETAQSQPRHLILNRIYISTAVILFGLVVTLCLSALLYFKHRALPLAAKQQIWSRFGSLCGVECIGCAISIAAWITRMFYLTYRIDVILYESGLFAFSSTADLQRNLTMEAIFYAMYNLLASLAFLFISVGKVLVLDRMAAFATHAAGPLFTFCKFMFAVCDLWFTVCCLSLVVAIPH